MVNWGFRLVSGKLESHPGKIMLIEKPMDAMDDPAYDNSNNSKYILHEDSGTTILLTTRYAI